MAIYSSILAWEIPCTEEPGGLQSMGCKESDMTEQLTLSLSPYWHSQGSKLCSPPKVTQILRDHARSYVSTAFSLAHTHQRVIIPRVTA